MLQKEVSASVDNYYYKSFVNRNMMNSVILKIFVIGDYHKPRMKIFEKKTYILFLHPRNGTNGQQTVYLTVKSNEEYRSSRDAQSLLGVSSLSRIATRSA